MIRAAVTVQYAAISALVIAALAGVDNTSAVIAVLIAAVAYITATRVEHAERAAERRRALDLHFPPTPPRRNQK